MNQCAFLLPPTELTQRLKDRKPVSRIDGFRRAECSWQPVPGGAMAWSLLRAHSHCLLRVLLSESLSRHLPRQPQGARTANNYDGQQVHKQL
jgi:hypothetical protein